jgi:hypothetical protein
MSQKLGGIGCDNVLIMHENKATFSPTWKGAGDPKLANPDSHMGTKSLPRNQIIKGLRLCKPFSFLTG